MRDHIWAKCRGSCNGCNICHGGLSICTICGGAEGSLTTTCPGERVPEAQQDRVYKEGHDFIGGVWAPPEALKRIRERLKAGRLAAQLSQLRTK